MLKVEGSFDVKMKPEPLSDIAAATSFNRMSIEKVYHGALEAEGKGEMLAAGTETKGSAAYVAIDKVTGKLGGRTGSFVLQHSGTMNRAVPALLITVVPDSGTGDL